MTVRQALCVIAAAHSLTFDICNTFIISVVSTMCNSTQKVFKNSSASQLLRSESSLRGSKLKHSAHHGGPARRPVSKPSAESVNMRWPSCVRQDFLPACGQEPESQSRLRAITQDCLPGLQVRDGAQD